MDNASGVTPGESPGRCFFRSRSLAVWALAGNGDVRLDANRNLSSLGRNWLGLMQFPYGTGVSLWHLPSAHIPQRIRVGNNATDATISSLSTRIYPVAAHACC